MMKIYSSQEYASINKKDNHLYRKVFSYLKPQKEDRVLEIGCGRGFLTREIQKFSKKTIGIDLNPEAVSQGMAPNLRIMDGTNLEFPADYFDKIYSCHTIEHIPDLKRLFKEIERVLKPGGKALLVYPWEIFRGMGAIGASLMIYKNPFRCRKIHLHKLNPQKIEKMLENSELESIKSYFSLFVTPQYFTILGKNSGE